jgi:cytochrome c-type biogenesis protein CcmE
MRSDDLKIRFDVTDGNREITVACQGVLPDLFREGQGAIADSGQFTADTILPSTTRFTCRRK